MARRCESARARLAVSSEWPSPFVLPGVPVVDSIGPDSDQRRHGALLERVDTIKRVPLPVAHVRVEALEGMESHWRRWEVSMGVDPVEHW